MKILLIEPPFERLIGFYRDYFPIGLTYLAAVLEKEGHQVKVYDAEHNPEVVYLSYSTRAERYNNYLNALKNLKHRIWQEAREVMEEFNPDLVGISVMTVKYVPALLLADLAKKVNPSCIVVFGGSHPTVLPEQTIENSSIDFVIRGEGELTLSELVKGLVEGGSLSDIPGLSYKHNGKVMHSPQRELVAELDAIPFPARSLLHRSNTYNSEDMGLVMTSRGCPFKCTYCATRSMWGRQVRFRSVENVIEELKHLVENFGVKQVTFEDDSFTVNRKRVLEFCQKLISLKLPVNWSAITRIDLLDEELLLQMKRAGCNHIRIGIESGSERVLRAIKKGIDIEQMKRGAELLNKHGIYWSAYFMVGLPMEEEDDIQNSLKLMKEINPSYSTLSIFTPYPGTELFNQVVESGLVSNNEDWSKISHHSPYNYFTPKIPPQEFRKILAEVSKDFDKYNRRPGALLAKAKIRSKMYVKEPKRIASDAKRLLYWLGILKVQEKEQ